MRKKINYQFFHWGPFLYRTILTDEEISKIKKLCKKDMKKDNRKNLAGLIKNEYVIDEKKLFPIIFQYLESYCRASQQHWSIFLGNEVTLESSWVNYMTKFESNPLHVHEKDLSFVIFLNVPEELKIESKNTVARSSLPGAINFVNTIGNDPLFINSLNFFPEKNDMFIFPAKLHHFVNSFKSEGERISVSGNITLKKYGKEI